MIDMVARRTTLLLAAFYLLQATWLLHAGVDLLFPRVQQMIAGADACCARRCGCPEEAQQRKTCCCAKESPGPDQTAVPRPASSIEEARCRGVEAAMAQAFTQPVVCSVAEINLPTLAFDADITPEHLPLNPPFAVALEKVPIAQA
ncbi:MAG TPA: hypothetical protein VE981_10640 [Planctomycetota bacterium]|nr:hypothetical protein [Planctomycetota bacterium]